MSDLDRTLGDALRSIKDEHIREIAAEAPAARRALQEKVAPRRRAALGGGFAFAAAALAAVVFVVSSNPSTDGVDRGPQTGDGSVTRPADGVTPSDRCNSLIGFEPTYLPRGMVPTPGIGSGGQYGLPLSEQQPPVVIHYANPGTDGVPTAYIDVHTIYTGIAPQEAEQIDVLGGPALLASIEDGFWVGAVEQNECSYEFTAYGLDRDQVRKFAEGLVPSGEANQAFDAFALWPETVPEEAYASCLVAKERETFRNDAYNTAAVFIEENLRWNEPSLEEGPYKETEGFLSITARRDGSPGAPYVDISVREVAPSCWSVMHVQSGRGDESYLSASKNDRTVTLGFDIDHRAEGQDVATVEMIYRDDNGEKAFAVTASDFDEQGFIEGRVDGTTKPTFVLVLLQDGGGNVVGAIGMPLPSGDFAAG